MLDFMGRHSVRQVCLLQAFNGRGGPFLPTPMIGGFPRPMPMGGPGRGMHGMGPMAGRGMNGMMAGRGMNGMGGMPGFGMAGEHDPLNYVHTVVLLAHATLACCSYNHAVRAS